MSVAGTLAVNGQPLAVTGQAWMDHQWGNFLSLAGAGWDWYSLQLTNNTEYMLYIIRDAQKRPISVFGTAVAPDGAASEIASSDIHIQATGEWRSPVTGGVYPSGWIITIPSQSLSLSVTPLLRDQELVTTCSTGVAYWEGAVAIADTGGAQSAAGVGYVELTGYATTPANASCLATP
jgi:predicted secreted hydrolase